MHPILPALAGLAVGASVATAASLRARSAQRLAGATLEALLNAIDANDPVTGAHVRRVAEYALILADAARLADDERRSVERVALFHDVGKIHEALFDIIHDAESLTPDERRAIATHPERGAQVLAPLAAFYPDLPDGVLAHHERWDGQGYPRGLAGDRIPLSARIVAVADTFDAITHARRYRSGESADRAVQVLREGAGSQFDPEFVALFLRPDVFARVERVRRAPRAAPRSRHETERRQNEREALVPDVRFRWRRPGAVLADAERERAVAREEGGDADAASRPRRAGRARAGARADASPERQAPR